MDTTESQAAGILPDVETDAQAVIDQVLAGKPVDPEVARRVHERAHAIRQEVLEKCGVLDVAVDLIRETRDDA